MKAIVCVQELLCLRHLLALAWISDGRLDLVQLNLDLIDLASEYLTLCGHLTVLFLWNFCYTIDNEDLLEAYSKPTTSVGMAQRP
jgi:hypothetical protein